MKTSLLNVTTSQHHMHDFVFPRMTAPTVSDRPIVFFGGYGTLLWDVKIGWGCLKKN